MGSFAQEFLGCIRKLRVFVIASPTLLGSCLLSLLGDGGGAWCKATIRFDLEQNGTEGAELLTPRHDYRVGN